ncbi:MAG TPA: EAL domain-containing protein [Burkholderiales bacterium]|nr:EAL domain-containing protein [Burkholderiales bacterium]
MALFVVALLVLFVFKVVDDLRIMGRAMAESRAIAHYLDDVRDDRLRLDRLFRQFLMSGNEVLASAYSEAAEDMRKDWLLARHGVREINEVDAEKFEIALNEDREFKRDIIDQNRVRSIEAARRAAAQPGAEFRDAEFKRLLASLESTQDGQLQKLQAQRDASIVVSLKIAVFLLAILMAGLGLLYWLIRASEARKLEALKALNTSEKRFRGLVELSADWYWEQDENLRFSYIPAEAPSEGAQFGASSIGVTRRDLPGIDLTSANWDAHEETLRNRRPLRDFAYRRFTSTGEARWSRVSANPIHDENGRFLGYLGVASDITQQRKSEQEIMRLKDLYAALSQTNRAIIHCRDAQSLFDEVCRVAVEHGRFRLAWIGMVAEGGWIVPAALHGVASDVFRRVKASINPDIQEGQGFNGAVVREGRHFVCNDYYAEPRVAPWRELARATGVKSAAFFPLHRRGECVGTLTLHGNEVNFFTEQLVSLLQEMSTNISFALDNLQSETEREAAKRALDASEQKFRHLADSVPEMFWTADPKTGQITYVSPAYEKIFGYSVADFRDPWLFVHPDDMDDLKKAYEHVCDAKQDYEFRIIHPDGEVRWLHARSFPIEDEHGEVTLITGITEDITLRKLDEEKLQRMAHYDSMTDLPNRSLFYDRLRQTVLQAKREGRLAAVIFVDVDHFKHVNDTMGHAAGDQLLQQVSRRLEGAVRTGDTVGRLGGDEFAVLLTNIVTGNDAGYVAKKLIAGMREAFDIEGHEVFVSASVGITLFPEDSDDPDTLIRNADVAMYRAKELGRNTYQFFKAEMNARALERMSMETHLRRALERNEFQLHYQPKIDLGSGEITGLEALLRWRHPELGLVPPSRFIPVAEDNGMIIEIGDWVIQEVCRQLQEWRLADIAVVPVAVNISGRQLAQRDIDTKVQKIIDDSGIAPRLLEFEITESVLMRDPEKTSMLLRGLRQLGIRLSVDDFGTGYSSLNYLKSFPLDTLKIDRSFVKDIVTNPDDAMITRAIISMAHSLRLKVVAEGVETAAQQTLLAADACDEVQGFLFSPAIAHAEIAAMLRDRRRLHVMKRNRTAESTVLMVDDDPMALELARNILRDEGYHILTALNGDDALDLLATNEVNAVVTDQRMPGMTGVELLRRVRGLYPGVARIVVSVEVDAGMATEAINQGAVFKILSKSEDPEQLRVSLREAFAKLH